MKKDKNPTAPAPDSVFAPPKADPDWRWDVLPVISLRDYFASHAPFPPPEWFIGWFKAEDGDVMQKSWIQWPYAWAELQLAAREAGRQQPEQPETGTTGCLSRQSSPEHAPEAVSGQQEVR